MDRSFFPSRFLAVFYPCLLYIALCLIVSCQCKILTLNNRYSQFQTLRSAEVRSFNHGDSLSQSLSLQSRVKRQTKTTPPKFTSDRSVLNGTERSNHAFVHWIGKETSEKVIVLTCQVNITSGISTVVKSQLWGSDDYGSSFKSISLAPAAKISYFYTFPTNSQKLLFADVKAKKVYTTVDEMANFKTHDVPVEPDIVFPHPSKEDKILIYSFTERKLYVSHDFAQTWSLLSENVLQKFYWGIQGYDTDTDIVHMEVASSSPDKAKYKACIGLKCTDATSSMGHLGSFTVDTLIVYKEFMFVQKSNLNGSGSYIMVSHKRQPFKRAFFPGNVITDDFILLNLDDGQVFVGVTHKNTVNLYLSDSTGHNFVLSFSDVYHVIHPYWIEIDLHEVQGMPWTFMVNKRVANIPNGIKSYISFDKGGNWGPIPMNKELKKQCKGEDCHLQLNIKASPVMTSVLSSKTAPGLIIAHGVLVPSKNAQPQPVSVFTSRDGGWTWKKAPFEGINDLNILDQGSILTAIPNGLFSRNKSKILHYSLDEGATWITALFDNASFMVNSVLTDPKMLTLTEMTFGHEGFLKPWVLIKLNFSHLLPDKCEEKSYESWFPKDYNDVTQNNCTMGQLIEYKRRKQNAKCHNGELLIPRLMSNNSCECTREDYECDFGYEEKGSKCSMSSWYYEGYLPVECKVGGEPYYKSQGYRKVSSDACDEKAAEAKTYGKVKAKCEVVNPHGLSITTHSLNVAVGRKITFYLSQTGGSMENTKYTWNLGDGSNPKVFGDFALAKQFEYTFAKAGHFKVSVEASNLKGKASSTIVLHAQDELSDISMVSPLSGKAGVPVTISVVVASSLQPFTRASDHAHYIWTFGDEAASARALLTWDNSVPHTYAKEGLYQVTVEAVNSVGSLYRQYEMHIYDNVEILVLTFEGSGIVNISNPAISGLVLQRLHYQLADDLGLGLNRLETTLSKQAPRSALLYIYPSEDPKQEKIDSIKQRVMDLVNSGNFAFSLLGKRAEGGLMIKVVSAGPYSPQPDVPKHKGHHGPNLKAVYICAPILIILVISFAVGLVCYCRRKRRSAHQYNMLHMQDDSDTLLDDEDDPPLDLNIDFRGRGVHRDDPLMDSGNSQLVMQDNVENC